MTLWSFANTNHGPSASEIDQALLLSYLKEAPARESQQQPQQSQQPSQQQQYQQSQQQLPPPKRRRVPPQPPIRIHQLPPKDSVDRNITTEPVFEKFGRVSNAALETTTQLSSSSSSSSNLPLYIQQHCNLSGVDHWMPPEEDNDWRRRTPRFIILGAKKGGTTGVFASLVAHPHVMRGKLKELLYFIPVRFPHWTNDQVGQAVRVGPARKQLWEEYFPTARIRKNQYWMTGEATPDYLLYSKYSAQAILCTVPWAKLIVLLREPLDRMFSHYNFIRDPYRMNRRLPPFERWIRTDIQRLQSAGVLPQNLSDIPQYMHSEQERIGWDKYQLDFGKHLMDRPVARSLYAIQLEQWFEHFAKVGKDPAKDLRVILSHEIKHNATITQELLDWLGVKQSTGVRGGIPTQQQEQRVKQAMVTTYTSSSIPPAFQKWLTETIFVHYNRRLYKLLGPRFEGAFDLQFKEDATV